MLFLSAIEHLMMTYITGVVHLINSIFLFEVLLWIDPVNRETKSCEGETLFFESSPDQWLQWLSVAGYNSICTIKAINMKTMASMAFSGWS